MPLAHKIISQKGRILALRADFGYGWREYDSQRREKYIETPSDFDFIFEDYWEVGGEIVAVLGRVIQPEHFLDGFELCALPMPCDEIDFDENIGYYALLLSPERGQLTGRQPPPHFESVDGTGYPEYRGYAGKIHLK